MTYGGCIQAHIMSVMCHHACTSAAAAATSVCSHSMLKPDALASALLSYKLHHTKHRLPKVLALQSGKTTGHLTATAASSHSMHAVRNLNAALFCRV